MMIEPQSKPEHVILVAFVVHGDSREQAEALMTERLDGVIDDDTVNSWWVAEDDRKDRSDCDSAVFVWPGAQRAAHLLLAAAGLTREGVFPEQGEFPVQFDGTEI